MAKLHRDVHMCTADTDREYNLPDQEAFFEDRILSSNLFTPEDRQKLIRLLHDLCADGEKKVCHGDFHGRNILTDTRKLYLIDWPEAYIGDPCADVAGALLISGLVGVRESGRKDHEDYIRLLARLYLKKYLRLGGGVSRNNLSCNKQRSIRHSDAPLLMWVYKRNAPEWCV